MQTPSHLVRRVGITATLLVVAVAFAQPNPEPKAFSDAAVKAVLETNAKMTQAADSLDADTFFTYILDSDQCVIIQNGKVFKTRREALDAVKRGFMGITKMDRQFEKPQVTVISPEVALLTSEGTVTATLADGQSRESRFAVSLIFVRRDGQWKVLHGHYSMPPRL